MTKIKFINNEIENKYLDLCKEKISLEKYPDRLTEEYYRVWGNADYIRYKWICDKIKELENIYKIKK